MKRFSLVLLTLMATAYGAADDPVTIAEPAPVNGDGKIELLRKAVYSLDLAADALGE